MFVVETINQAISSITHASHPTRLVRLLIALLAAPFSINSVTADTHETKANEKAEIAELRAKAETEWPERWEKLMVSDKPWPNTADQLRYDLSAAILSLQKGRQIMLDIQELSFANGSALVTTYQKYSDIYEGIPEGKFEWSNWFDKTNAASAQRGYNITCQMAPDALATVKVGQTYIVDAVLATLQGEHVSLTCTNPYSPADSVTLDQMCDQWIKFDPNLQRKERKAGTRDDCLNEIGRSMSWWKQVCPSARSEFVARFLNSATPEEVEQITRRFRISCTEEGRKRNE